MTTPTEGVIKFQMEFSPAAPRPAAEVAELSAWRTIMKQLGLISQEPGRYGGYGFGNISQRLAPFEALPEQRRFLISGTQTGHLLRLTGEHFATVIACRPAKNLVMAEGPIRPSSESMTHGVVYAVADAARWVVHAHSPEIWRQRRTLGLPATAADIPYGTVDMAEAVRRLFAETNVGALGIFAMDGHEDGIVTFGPTAAAAAGLMVDYLSRAYQLAGADTL
jgi:hypothetical protein